MFLNIMHCRSSNSNCGVWISVHSSAGMGHLKTGVDTTPEMSVVQNIPHILDNVQHNITKMNHLLSQKFRQQSQSLGEYILYSSLKSVSGFVCCQ